MTLTGNNRRNNCFISGVIVEEDGIKLDLAKCIDFQLGRELIADNANLEIKDGELIISNIELKKYNYDKTDEILEKTFVDIDRRIREAKEILDKKGITRTLHIISLSDDEASKSYMNRKVEQGSKYGVQVLVHKPKDIEELHELIFELRADMDNRVIIQKPYDEKLWGRTDELLGLLPKIMDVDGFEFSLMDLSYIKTYEDIMNIPTFSPTAKGVISIMNNTTEDLRGKKVTVIGKGLTSGLPIATILQQLGCTILWVNSSTDNDLKTDILPNLSDFIISCAGKPNILEDYFNNGYNIKSFINVGMSKDNDGKLRPDIDCNQFIEDRNVIFCNKLFGTTGKLTTMNLILNTLL